MGLYFSGHIRIWICNTVRVCWRTGRDTPLPASLVQYLLIYKILSGYYIYAEASRPRNPGDRARLLSPLVTGTTCLVFRFNMNGAEMGTLRIYAKVGPMEQRLWERSGNQGKTWNGYHFRVMTTARFQVRMLCLNLNLMWAC